MANINSVLPPSEMFMAAIDFVGSHFVYFWLFPLDSCSIVFLAQKPMIAHQNYSCSNRTLGVTSISNLIGGHLGFC